MFKKQENPTKKEPTLQGEDFDMYPDMGEHYSYQSEIEAEEAADEPDTPAEPTAFEKWAAAISESNWKKLQIAGGGLLGLLSGLALTKLNNYATFSSYGLIAAVFLAMVIPNIIEKKAGRRIAAGRIAIIVVLALTLGLFLLNGLVLNPEPAA